MNGRLILLGLFSGALLACGDAQNLSVGELRCEGVSCAPIGLETIDGEYYPDIEQVDRDEELVPVIGQQLFCADLPSLSEMDDEDPTSSRPSCFGEKLIPVGEERFLIATKYMRKLDSERVESGLRLAHYAGGELQWESTEISRELANNPRFFGDAFEIASGDEPGELIVGVTRETGMRHAYGQSFYSVAASGELVDLFDDEDAGRIHALAVIDEDLLVASDYEARLELTRYTTDGVIVWRQTALRATEAPSDGGAIAFDDTSIRVIDGDRIIVLVPIASGMEVMELTAEGELARSWTNWSVGGNRFLNTRLAAGRNEQFFVGMDGYTIERCSLSGDEPRKDSFSKQRTQYYEPAVLGLQVDRAGYLYIATIDGDLEQPLGLIERISPDFSRRESFVIGAIDVAPGWLSVVIGGELFVSDDQRTLYFAANGTLGSIELPPIED